MQKDHTECVSVEGERDGRHAGAGEGGGIQSRGRENNNKRS